MHHIIRCCVSVLTPTFETNLTSRGYAYMYTLLYLSCVGAGGTPAQHGVYYDVSYDSKLSPPGSKCKTKGTVVSFSSKNRCMHACNLLQTEYLHSVIYVLNVS